MEYAIKQTFQHKEDKSPLGTIDIRVDVVSATINGKPMPNSSIEWAWNYGVRKGFADSYAAGKTQSERQGLFNKRLDAAIAGSIGGRIRNVTSTITKIIRDIVKAQLMRKPNHWKKFSALKDTAAKNEYLDKIYTQYETVFKPLVDAEIARRASLPQLDIDFDLDDETAVFEPEH